MNVTHNCNRDAFIKQEDRARELMPIVTSFTQKSVMHLSFRCGDFPYTRLLRFTLFTELSATRRPPRER